MNTRAACYGSALEQPRAPLQLLQRQARPAGSVCAAGAGLGWMERLAAWADRQPAHRRVGSWERPS